MQTALVSAPLASTPPQHTPSRPRRSTSNASTGAVVAFRTTEGEVGSYSRGGGSSAVESGSWRSGLSKSTSLGESSLLSHPRSIPKSSSFVKVEGFNAPPDAATTSPPMSPGREMSRATSLLSRELSVDNLSTLPRPVASPALSSLAERLEAQVLAESAVKPPPPRPVAPPPPRRDTHPAETDTMLKQLQGNFAVFREPLVVHAFNIARAAHVPRAHDPQGDSAFARCAGTAVILAELGADEVAVASALLHDILDHTMLSEPRLREMLRHDETVEMVKRVSHMNYICQKYSTASNTTALSAIVKNPAGGGEAGLASHMVGLLVAHGPPRALLVRLAVALQEARSLDSRSSASSMRNTSPSDRLEKRQRAAAEALQIWAPLANRLGVWSLKAELEDRAFRTLCPAEHAELRDRLETVQEPTRLIALVDALRSQLQDVGVEYIDLSGRPKHLWGVWKKMQAKGYSAERVRDVRGLRVIVKSREDCYLALRAVEKAWAMVGESKNYIKAPKANGYQSLHAVADPGDGHLVEVQIRTDKMHYLAEYGAEAAHWRYKEGTAAAGGGGMMSSGNSLHTGGGGSSFSESGGSASGATREANWAKFMTSQHVAQDKKCRPSGSPTGDQSLSSILAFMEGGSGSCTSSSDADDAHPPHSGSSPGALSTSAAAAAAALSGTSPGGSSSKGRTFQEYIAASGQRLAPPEEQRALVAVIAGDAFSVAELPAGTTVAQLLKYCNADGHATSLHVVVNRQVETDASTELFAGDVVELYVEEKSTVKTSSSGGGSSTRAARGNMMPLGGLAQKLIATRLTN